MWLVWIAVGLLVIVILEIADHEARKESSDDWLQGREADWHKRHGGRK